MNRIVKGSHHEHLPPMSALGARKEGAANKTMTTTSTSANSIREILLQGEMQELIPPPCAERSLLPELAKGLALTSTSDADRPSPPVLSTSTPKLADSNPPSSYPRGIDTSRSGSIQETCIHPNEAINSSKQGLCAPKKEKAVSFATTARVRIVHRKTDKELQEVWYSHEEKEQLMLQAREAVKLRRRFMSENDFEDEYQESTLGIEHFLSKTFFKELQREKEEVIQAVLLFQETMMAQNQSIDHEALARAYSTLSSPARERAYLMGRDHSLPFSHVMGQSEQRKQRHQRSSRDCGLHVRALPSSASVAR